MSSTDSIKSHDSEQPNKPPPSSKARIQKLFHWKRGPRLAVVLWNGSSRLTIEEINDVNSMYAHTTRFVSFTAETVPTGESDAFEIDLPRWRNRVEVYADMKNHWGYAATLRLDRLGLKKNWQRRLGLNYNVLHVKGNKITYPV